MIVNDKKAKLTTDRETGVSLVQNGGSLGDKIYAFTLVDDETLIGLFPTRSVTETAPQKYRIDYQFQTPPTFTGQARRKNYLVLIAALVEAFGYYYGNADGRYGDIPVSMTFSDEFRTALVAWEVAHG